MKIRPSRTGASEFLSVYNRSIADAVMIHKADLSRLYNLRCSQLPYCPRSVLVNYATRGLFQSMDMMMAYYVGVGHAVHSVMQNYLATSGQLLADYDCRHCGTKYPLSFQHECCGSPTRYEEVTIDYKGIQGHIDAIFKDKQGRYWIVDFKTTSLAGVGGKIKNAPEGYRRQVRAYAYLLWKQYKIQVHGLMLVYIPRDNPRQPGIWEYVLKDLDWGRIAIELKADKRLHRDTMAASSLADFRALFKNRCGGEYCEPCKKSAAELIAKVKSKIKKFPIKKLDQESAHV